MHYYNLSFKLIDIYTYVHINGCFWQYQLSHNASDWRNKNQNIIWISDLYIFILYMTDSIDVCFNGEWWLNVHILAWHGLCLLISMQVHQCQLQPWKRLVWLNSSQHTSKKCDLEKGCSDFAMKKTLEDKKDRIGFD